MDENGVSFFQTLSVAPLSMGRLKEKYLLRQQLSVPRVTILLLTSHKPFDGEVSLFRK